MMNACCSIPSTFYLHSHNTETFKMVDDSTRKELLTRCFSLQERGGAQDRHYLFKVDPTVIPDGEALKVRAEWMEAIELATGRVGLGSFDEPDEHIIIDRIIRLPPSCFLSPAERAVCWGCRDKCCTRYVRARACGRAGLAGVQTAALLPSSWCVLVTVVRAGR